MIQVSRALDCLSLRGGLAVFRGGIAVFRGGIAVFRGGIAVFRGGIAVSCPSFSALLVLT